MKEKRILTIVVTYNFEPWLNRCLDSLAQSTVRTDVLVVDNASNDATVERIRKEYPRIRLIENDQNLGFGKANNIGFDIAIQEDYDYVFLANQDAWIKPDCLEKLLEADKDRQVAILSPMHYDGTGVALERGFATYLAQGEDEGEYFEVPFVNAAFWLVSVRILKLVGGFSPLFYHYGEDSDFANRLRHFGFATRVVKCAVAYHDRQDRIVDRARFFYGEYVYFLTEYANICHRMPKSILLSLGAALKKSGSSLVRGQISDAAKYVMIFWKLLAQSHKVVRTRRSNRYIPLRS